MNKQLFSKYGLLWARNDENITQLHQMDKGDEKLNGVYVLCDGSMPVYIGRGRIWRRINGHKRSKSRGQFWDHFSWFGMPDRGFESDVEALLLRMLPFYIRSLNKLRNNFVVKDAKVEQINRKADPIDRPRFAAQRKQGNKKRGK